MKWLELLFGKRLPDVSRTIASDRTALAQALEPRMMFDGAIAASVAEAQDTTAAVAARAADDAAETDAGGGSASAGNATAGRQEVVFVDGPLQDNLALLDGLPADAEVVVLDTARNGLEQMAEYLQGRSGIEAIHLLSHGESGAFKVGDSWIDGASLAGYGEALERIGAALSADGDILLYGCKTGDGEAGSALVAELARLTRADVAVSSDNTGAVRLGGDWVLESRSGIVETSALALDSYDGLLAAPTSLNFDSIDLVVDGDADAMRSFGTSPRIIDGWTITLNNAAGDSVNDSLGFGNFLDVTSVSADTDLANGGSDKAMTVTGYYSTTPGDPLAAASARFTATSGEQFALNSFVIQNLGMNAAARVVGYRDGVAVASQDFTINTGAGVFSTITPNSAADADWQNIDEFRIVQQGGEADIWFAIDDISVSPAVLPNVAPVLGNLNGDSVSFTEGGSAVLLDAGGNATLVDGDSTDFNGGNITVAITANRVAGEDVVSVRNQGSGAGQVGLSGSAVLYGGVQVGTLTGGTGSSSLVISLNAQATPEAVQAVLRNLTYNNTNATDPSTASRSIQISVNDGDGGTSNLSVVSVSVTGVNDAPTASATGATPAFTENGSAVDLFSGVSISAVESAQSITGMTLTVTNLADGASEILTIDGTSVTLTNGFSTTTATNAMNVTVSVEGATATVTLSKAGGIGTASAQSLVDGIAYRNTSESPATAGNRAVTLTSLTDSGGSANGGVDTASLAIAATVTVVAVNDAPTLSGGPYALPATNEDTTSGATPVSTILAGLTHGEVDAGSLSGIAISASTGSGTWQYSTDGVTWNGVGAVSGSAALLLSSDTQLRYVPDGTNGETATLTFRAWDQSSGSSSTNGTRSTADTTSNGGTTAFSTGTAQASLAVTAVNDAPVLTPTAPTLTGISDTDINNAGQTVASIVGTSIADVDSGALQGIAITGLASGTGTWQFSLDGGSSWTDVGAVAANSALLLRATDRVRFVPDGVSGTTASLTYAAWDQSGGAQGTRVDTSSAGGSTPFSSASDTAGITVTAVDDPSTVSTSGGTTAFTEGNNVTSTPVAIDPGLTLSDSDSTTLASATVSISGNFISAQDVLAFVNDGSTMGNITSSYSAGTGVLTLTSAGGSATLAQWQAALRSVTYSNGSDLPNTSTRTISFAVNDGSSDSNTATRAVSVTSVNESPVITTPASLAVTEDVASALTGVSFSDVDAGSSVVTATFSVGSGTLAGTSGAGVTVSGSGTGALTLTGTVANINAFIAAGNLAFTTAANATSNVTLTVGINDGGNTGSGGAQTDSETVTLQVAAVNDAPVISAPASINVDEDVSTALTGISFADVDAGGSAVTVSLSVASGTLSAISGAGVTVSGSGGNSLTLSGNIADINAFVAASQLSFLTASNDTSNVVLTIQVEDFGNTGNGGSKTDITTVTLVATAENDAPVNSVPPAQAVDQDAVLVFSAGNGNLISISDVDAGSGNVRVALTATNGLLTLGGTTGLSFITGDGTADATMTFEGALTDINLALNGMSFLPTGGYNGPASLQIASNDLGLSGSGGNQVDSDTVAITVNSLNPEITSVNVNSPDGGYKVGDSIQVTVTFDQAVNVDTTGGVPTLLLETGSVDRLATYVSGSGSNTLTFSYTVQAGDISADLDYQSTGALALNGATIRNATSDDAVLTLPTVGGADSIAGQHDLLIDGVAPTVASVSVPANGTYVAGQNLDFTVNFSEVVTVDTSGGTPRIAVTLDTGGTVFAEYLAGSGSAALVFRLTVASGQLDSNGITLGGSIQANGGTLRDAVGNAATPTLNSVGSTSGVLVDALSPVVASVSVPANGAYNAGDVLSFTVNASETVLVNTGGGTPRLALDIGGVTRYATYVSGSGTGMLVFQYSVQAGDTDADGIVVTGLEANGGTLRDAAGNSADLSLNSVAPTSGVIIDTTAPTLSSIVRAAASPTQAASVDFIVTFDEEVSGVDTGDFAVVATGTARGTVQAVEQLDGRTYRLVLGGVSGEGMLGVELVAAGSGIVDQAGNALLVGGSGASYELRSISGDPEYRANAPRIELGASQALPEVMTPVRPPSLADSPLQPPSLFEDTELGSGIPRLGEIFRTGGGLPRSLVAQVFSDGAEGNTMLGGSTLASIFAGAVVPVEGWPYGAATDGDCNSGNAGQCSIQGAPTLGQQLHEIGEAEQRELHDLARALGQVGPHGRQA